jgi:antitoxin component YwqK of YwqJK toxin-antitoxin module
LIKNYKDNLLQGEWKVYDENGSIVETGNYFEDKKDGKWTSYYDKYQIEKEELWSEGKLMEVISFFDDNGNVLARGTLKNGNGTVKKYNSDSKLIKTVEYIYGEVFDWNNSTQLNNLAWKIYENETDIGVLKNAIKWIKRSISLDENYYNTDTYAALLYKIGNYKQAIIVAKETIEIAKANGDNYKSTTKLVKDINVKLKK